MIEEIAIRDLGVIDEAVLPLGPGFTAVTGETGAGKTMVVTALGLLFGARADSATVRSGAAQAWVEGRLLVPEQGPVADRVREAGGDVEPAGGGDGELLMSRSVAAEGRSRAVVGGRSAPVGVLGDLAERLIVVHGQSDQLRLRGQSAQREALDAFGGASLATALASYREAWASWQAHSAELETLVAERAVRLREAEQLREALDEIEAVAPEPGEDARLADVAGRLTNVEDLRVAATAARDALSSDAFDERPDVVSLIDSARRSLAHVVEHDSALAPIVEGLDSASYQLSDLSTQLASYATALETDDPGELDRIQERRAQLTALQRKYGPELDDVLRFAEQGQPRLLELDGDSDRIEQLASLVDDEVAELDRRGAALSEERRRAAGLLGDRVSEELKALAMGASRLVVEVTERDEPGSSGKDVISFLLQSHQGTEPRALGKGASGGELSRVMLAIEVVLAEADPVPTFVFDEVDAGVGGAAAIEIGRRLAELARTSQVIVVTHLAQVAAFATNHLRVEKDSDGPITASNVRRLEGDERLAEMARLLSGLPDSESGLAHASELIDTARSLAG
ncbi:DNA repair protein RecN [Cnuibacter sp. UC19_7]|uniref:DNA repair protein RecN n=1 Tax=Cnuibacter sp. UC19_7 TaxID=3350166 RepID=UPI00366C8835